MRPILYHVTLVRNASTGANWRDSTLSRSGSSILKDGEENTAGKHAIPRSVTWSIEESFWRQWRLRQLRRQHQRKRLQVRRPLDYPGHLWPARPLWPSTAESRCARSRCRWPIAAWEPNFTVMKNAPAWTR